MRLLHELFPRSPSSQYKTAKFYQATLEPRQSRAMAPTWSWILASKWAV
jgi:hypothetical protein